MNMQNLMMQAQKLQKEISKTKEEIDLTIFKFENELVFVEMNGKKELKSIKIKQGIKDKEDVEILEDMILIAINECMKKIDLETSNKLGKYGNSLNGLI